MSVVKVEKDEMCRACLQNDGELVDLFWMMETSEHNLTLADIFMMCTPVEVIKEDGMPQSICENCINNLTSAYEFRTRCQQSDVVLRSMISGTDKSKITPQPMETPNDENQTKLEIVESKVMKNETYIKLEPVDDDVVEVTDEDAVAAANLHKLMEDDLNPPESVGENKDVKEECVEESDTLVKQECIEDKDAIVDEKADASQDISMRFEELCSDLGYSDGDEYPLEIDESAYQFNCTECSESYNCADEFSRHLELHALRRQKSKRKHKLPYSCRMCTKVFTKKAELYEHLADHSSVAAVKKRVITSEEADPLKRKKKKLPVTANPKKKIKKNSKKKKSSIAKDLGLEDFDVEVNPVQPDDVSAAVIPICEEDFTEEALKEEFLRIKTIRGKKNAKECRLCNKSMDRGGALKNHVVEHIVRYVRINHPTFTSAGINFADSRSTEIPFKCNFCCKGEEFFSIGTLKAHLWKFVQLTTYACNICNKTFGNSSNFSKHKKVHGLHVYNCSVCKRKFHSEKMLDKHKEYHLQNEPFECCGKVFHHLSTWKKHERSSHGTKITVKRVRNFNQCTSCARSFISMKDQWEHEWTEHGMRPYDANCEFCDDKFRNFSKLLKHVLEKHNVE